MKNLTFYSYVIVTFTAFMILNSCDKSEPTNEPEPPEVITTEVHIAGIGSTSNGTQIAKYWKNGKATNLSDGTKNNFALSIAVSGSDIYVAGYESNSAGKVAKYIGRASCRERV